MSGQRKQVRYNVGNLRRPSRSQAPANLLPCDHLRSRNSRVCKQLSCTIPMFKFIREPLASPITPISPFSTNNIPPIYSSSALTSTKFLSTSHQLPTPSHKRNSGAQLTERDIILNIHRFLLWIRIIPCGVLQFRFCSHSRTSAHPQIYAILQTKRKNILSRLIV